MKRIALASALLLSACTAQAQQDYGPPSEVQKIYDIAVSYTHLTLPTIYSV